VLFLRGSVRETRSHREMPGQIRTDIFSLFVGCHSRPQPAHRIPLRPLLSVLVYPLDLLISHFINPSCKSLSTKDLVKLIQSFNSGLIMTTSSTAPSAAAPVHSSVVPSEVGWQFVPQYYTFVNKHPNRLHCFYNKNSTFIHGTEGEDGKPCYGQQVGPSHLITTSLLLSLLNDLCGSLSFYLLTSFSHSLTKFRGALHLP